MGGIEECIFKVLGQEEIFGSTTYRVLCLKKVEK
jgi:hypothetical protein